MLKMLVHEAVRLRDKPVNEITAALDELRSRITLYAALDTLEYLKKGGRINKTAAAVGGMLKIKPVITVTDDGRVELIHKCIGMNAALKYIAELYNGDKRDDSYAVRTIYCMDSANSQKLSGQLGIANPVFENICPVIGTHIGPKAAGVVYVRAK